MTNAQAEMQSYYAARAPYYDAVYLKPERRADIEFLSAHLPQRFQARNVLEIACGTGYWTQHIARTANKLVATDGTREPLDVARLRPACDKVAFRQVDAYAIPLSLGRFDAAFAGLWFSHVPVALRRSFLLGLHAVLEPKARVIFIDNNDVQVRDFPIVETDADGNTYQQRELRDGSVHRVLKNFPSESELQALFSPVASKIEYTTLQNFWMLEYELA